MKFWLAIDDTDDATKSIGTGEIAQMISKKLVENGCDMQFGVTRHQLLLDPLIHYTSHNSAMCLAGNSPFSPELLWEIAVRVCREHQADSSNPGMCLFCPADEADCIRLMDFGRKAKKVILTIAEATELAADTPGMRLEALGGNGDGKIGALAGIGLRLGGNDGTFQGKKKIAEISEVFSVAEMQKKIEVSFIVDSAGRKLPSDAKVRIREHAKIIYWQFSRAAAGVLQEDGIYDICSLASVYEQSFRSDCHRGFCTFFEWDNDPGEQWSEQEGLCENCRYRRLMKAGFFCSLGREVDMKSIEAD